MCLTALDVSTPNKNNVLFNIKVIINFQMKLLLMISEKHFFNSTRFGTTVLLKFKQTVEDYS